MVFLPSLVILFTVAASLANPVTIKRADGALSDFTLDRRNNFTSTLALARRASAPNYNQDYTTGGTVSYSPGTSSFSVNWNTQNDFVVGKGWTTGSTSPITYSGTFSTTSGVGLLSVYGWSTNPLVEYYIMEDNHAFPNTDALKATYTSDGATYNMYEDTRVNEPSIQGTSTFNQYISIRQSPRTSGTVTVANHFAQWASHGMPLGTLSYQVLAVEGWGGAGSASESVSNTGTGSPAPAPTTTPPTTGGSCAALYGQCGGTGWTGAICCSAGTCKASNAYYSQCLN